MPPAREVHDSRAAREFILARIASLRQAISWVRIEVRMDSAVFSDEIILMIDEIFAEFSLSVPFERFVELKKRIEARERWRTFDET